MNPRRLLAGLLTCIPFFGVFAQIQSNFTIGYSYREVADNICNDPNNKCHYYKMVSWDDSQFEEFYYTGTQNGNVVEFLNWRMIFPLNYDSLRPEKYPMIIMLHGAGESGRIWTGNYNYPNTDPRFDNNGHNILHGGQEHRNAVNRQPSASNAFPGIVMWPQASYNGAWENGWDNGNQNNTSAMAAKALEWVIENYNVDADRVYMHGLSNGGKGTWDLAAKRPDLFAAILPMSGVGSNPNAMADSLVTMPIWLFQGGLDGNPNPQAAAEMISALQSKGGNPRYTLYPNLGHGVWQTAYGEADFFPWILSKNKKNIHVYGGDPSICAGGSLKLGFSRNLYGYQWTLNGVDIPGAKSKDYTATIAGRYAVKYQRQIDDVKVWHTSNPVDVTIKDVSDIAPSLTSTGSTRLPVNISGVDNRITLTAPSGYTSYEWYRNGVFLQTTGSNTRTFSNNQGGSGDAGNYTVRVLLPTGCWSGQSDPITVYWHSPQSTSPAIAPPSMSPISSTEMNVSWGAYSGEVGFEVWRIRFSPTFEPWTLVNVVDADETSVIDGGLRPQAGYRYIIRALHPDGGAVVSLEPTAVGTTPADLIPPTVPTNLIASNVTDTGITLSWDASTDNDVVSQYQIYDGTTLITTIGTAAGSTPPNPTVALSGLTSGVTYFLNVRATDRSGNNSPFAEGLAVTTTPPSNGINYKYYEFTGNIPGQTNMQIVEPQSGGSFNFNQTPTATGVVNNFDIGVRQQNDNFVFAFDGFIEIINTGTYTFFTSSDDGSRLYVNNVSGNPVVNNDGLHGTQERSGTVNFSQPGKYPIRVTFFEQGGGEVLTVQYDPPGTGTGNGKQTIPNNRLYRTGATVRTFYLRTGTGNPNALSSWTTSSSGSGGTSPQSFAGDQQYFMIANRSTVNISDNWTVSGEGSKAIVGSGVTLNLDAAFTGKMDAAANAIINVNTASVPQFSVLDPTSTVNFNFSGGTVAIPNASFGNVNLAGASQYTLPMSTVTVQGALSVSNGASTSGASSNLSVLRLGGDLTINDPAALPSSQSQQFGLIFTGGKNHTVNFSSPSDLNLFSLQADFGDRVTFNNPGVHTITLGSSQGGGLILKGSAVLDLNDDNLVITGRGTINPNDETGSIAMNGGNFTFTSTAPQNSNVYFSESGNVVNDFAMSVPTDTRVSVLNKLNVRNSLQLTGGQLNSNSGALTFLSDQTGTAYIRSITNNAKLTGTVTTQRFMEGEGRIYRYLSSPVQNATVGDLQDEIPVTGNFSGRSTGPGLNSSPSMYFYNEASGGYQAFPTTSNQETLVPGRGYSVFVREDSNPTTWDVVGTPNQGNLNFSLVAGTTDPNDGWNLLGNPYQSPIQWTGSQTGGWSAFQNISSTVYVRENFGSQYRWRVYRPGIDPEGLNEDQEVLTNGIIAPGQAFWVQAAANPGLTITESAKYNGQGAFFRTKSESEAYTPDVLSVKLSDGTYSDLTYILHDDRATPGYEKLLDAVKQTNSFFNLSSMTTDGVSVAINATPETFCAKEVPLNIGKPANGNYSLSFHGLSAFKKKMRVSLKDNYKGTTTEINSGFVYNFVVSNETATSGAGRFVVIEEPVVLTDLALKSFDACAGDPSISVIGAQPGVGYQAFMGGIPISETFNADKNGNVSIQLSSTALGIGRHLVSVIAGYEGCGSLPMKENVEVSIGTMETPVVTYQSGFLEANIAEADSYQWLLNGVEIEGATGVSIPSGEIGDYQVRVSVGPCQETSGLFNNAVTSIEAGNFSQISVHPNPFTESIIVRIPENVNFSTVALTNTLGQVIESKDINNLQSGEITWDLSALMPGVYIIRAGHENVRIVKKN